MIAFHIFRSRVINYTRRDIFLMERKKFFYRFCLFIYSFLNSIDETFARNFSQINSVGRY